MVATETSPKGLGMSIAEVYGLPAAVDLVTAARALSIGRTKAQELARKDEFPIPVLLKGRKRWCTKASLLRALDLEVPLPQAITP